MYTSFIFSKIKTSYKNDKNVYNSGRIISAKKYLLILSRLGIFLAYVFFSASIWHLNTSSAKLQNSTKTSRNK